MVVSYKNNRAGVNGPMPFRLPIVLDYGIIFLYPIVGGDRMAEKIKRALLALVVVFIFAGGSGCATTAGVGLGYHVPVTNGVNTGIYFGIGF
jgi:hypothetical protein